MSDEKLESAEEVAPEPTGAEVIQNSAEAVDRAEPAVTPETVTPIEEQATDEADDNRFSIHTLQSGQQLEGRVKNITSFGAFVDIGLPQDGLVHISELARRKVDKVSDVVEVGQTLEVWVKKVDQKRGRISLTMIKPIARRLRDVKEGAELEGVVTRLESYGAFVDVESERDGLVHISQITHEYIKNPEEALEVGQTVRVKVLKVNRKKRQIDLSMKAILPPPAKEDVAAAVVSPIKEIGPDENSTEPTPTAMAMAYAAMQSRSQDDKSAETDDLDATQARQKREMDEIVSRTLATSS